MKNGFAQIPIKVQMPPTVKSPLGIVQAVESSQIKYFWYRFLVIQNLSSKIMTSCKGFILGLHMEEIRLR